MSTLLFDNCGVHAAGRVVGRPRATPVALAITRQRLAEAGLWLCVMACGQTPSEIPEEVVDVDFVVESGTALQLDHTCLGQDRSPAVRWDHSTFPAAATHVALRARSRDGLMWMAWDHPVGEDGLQRAIIGPTAPPTQGANHRGRIGWAGPCPPAKARGKLLEDSVEIELYVTSRRLGAPPTSSPTEVVERAERHLIGYSRQLLDLDLR